MTEASRDAFLAGRVTAMQPRAGHHRSGLDAVLLAAAFSDKAKGSIVDLGAGAGVAGFCLAARAEATRVTLAEREAGLVALGRAAAALPENAAFAARLTFAEADILDAGARGAAGLVADRFDGVLMNPPFHDEGSVRASPDGARARAHVLDPGGLDGWFRAAAALLKGGGSLAVILPAARLGDLLASMARRFGGVTVLPIHPRADEPAIRVLARGVKGSRAPITLLPGLALHEGEGNAASKAARAMLGDGASLADVHMSWRRLGFDP
ncbi:methyltransferase [Kaistia geumhonensis]|uniref:tRNA1(Val) A37 N6-methylase TrmN6 n=1 Tax=Kaistia geumhonensis TaxID=410839 RepID=A0ABU0MBE2_9HYPH|nr:methyltransferase [Kaistia geumhonensis]MCX5481231.1 methyltransferase [Kaistia geumhonensis]MDQ0518292.1 tRNA1(Val) A37 N6-methylase TrmN6 [Kaistia geumhonensis]